MPGSDALVVNSPPAPRTPPADPWDGIAPGRHVTLHLLEEDGVLFDASRQAAYAVNATGTFIWCCLEDRLEPATITTQLAQTYSISPAAAWAYVRTAVRTWRDFGLLSAPSGSIGDGCASAVSSARPDAPDALPRRRAPRSEEGVRRYVLLDTGFQIRLQAPVLQEEIELLLEPLSGRYPTDGIVRLDFMEQSDGFLILREGRPYAQGVQLDQAVPLIKTCLIDLALRRSGDFGAVHAAALRRDGICLLLAGVSGAGKSTLTAALVAAGFELMADDTTVLARETLDARPVPFAICLKEGAWELLNSRFPELCRRPVHHRLDGKKVRYLVPGRGCARTEPAKRCRVDKVIFLSRVPEAKSSLQRIARSDALSRFAKEFCPLGEGLTAATMDRLVRWMLGLDCFELRYSPLDDGVERILQLCA